MSVSKNRRVKRHMKKRKFATVKSARRYVRRFRPQFLYGGKRHNKGLAETMAAAIEKILSRQAAA